MLAEGLLRADSGPTQRQSGTIIAATFVDGLMPARALLPGDLCSLITDHLVAVTNRWKADAYLSTIARPWRGSCLVLKTGMPWEYLPRTRLRPSRSRQRGSKHHLLVDECGLLPVAQILGAQVHDLGLIIPLVASVPAVKGLAGHAPRTPT